MNSRYLKVGISVLAMTLIGTALHAQDRSKKNGDKKKASVEEVFKKRDKNEDGKLEKSELIGWVSNDFSKLDTDNNGTLSLEEFSNAAKFQNRKRKRGKRLGPDEIITRLDADSDGRISKSEAKGRLAEHFDRIDTDNDGFVSKKELENAPRGRGKGSKKRN